MISEEAIEAADLAICNAFGFSDAENLTRIALEAAAPFIRAEALEEAGMSGVCGWWVGPVWKLDGETCVCKLEPGHAGGHECTCGSWFDGCGYPAGHRKSEAP